MRWRISRSFELRKRRLSVFHTQTCRAHSSELFSLRQKLTHPSFSQFWKPVLPPSGEPTSEPHWAMIQATSLSSSSGSYFLSILLCTSRLRPYAGPLFAMAGVSARTERERKLNREKTTLQISIVITSKKKDREGKATESAVPSILSIPICNLF